MSAPVIRLGTVGSTMAEAAALAQAGCVHGTAVVAEAQTEGIGRHGHSWHSEPGNGLYVSVVLRLPLGPEELPVVTLALGLAAAEAIALSTGLACDLRWPNDVLAGGKKVGGILVQVVENAAIAGIGINVNHAAFPQELAEQATSIRLAIGRVTDREALLAQVLRSIEDHTQVLVNEGQGAIFQLFAHASSYVEGKRVTVDLAPGKRMEGVTAGLTSQGFLRIRKADGTIHTVLAGGVRPI